MSGETVKMTTLTGEIDRLLSADEVMKRVASITEESGVVLTEEERAALWKVADSGHAMMRVSHALDEERIGILTDLTNFIDDYDKGAIQRLLSGPTSMLQ